MYKELLHLYGPFAIQSYGLCIALGLFLILFLIQRHSTYKKLHLQDHINSLTIIGVLTGLLGGRLLYTISEADGATTIIDFFSYWQGGFSILGCVISICIFLPLALKYYQIPILPFLDLLAVYAPLLQSISRIGCLFAGCCYGIPTHVCWAVTYYDPNSIAPLHICLHPTQLYSSVLLFITFCLMFWVLQYQAKKPGQLVACYLILTSFERFIVDFWRAHRIFFNQPQLAFFSVHQWIALTLIGCGVILLFMSSFLQTSKKPLLP